MTKNAFFFICLFSLILPGIGQESANQNMNKVDDRGRKQGLWKSYDVKGKLKYEGKFVDDIPTGTFTYYYPDGMVKAISEMSDNGRRSYTKLFHTNGRLMGEGNYLDKVKDGTWNYYSDFDGVKVSTEHYVEGKLEGVIINYYPEGVIAEQIPYKHGLKEGEWTQYFSDGKIKLKATYVNDLIEGLMLIYYQNGIPEVSGIYKNNLKHGQWMYFTDKGVLYKKETYANGQLKNTEEF